MSEFLTESKENIETKFRADLRSPEVGFGRCAVTGEWGTVICLDLGNLSIEAPNTEKGVEYDPNTGQVNFTVWSPQVFEQQLTVSRQGLQMLIEFMDSEDSPIPTITPDLFYQWGVMNKDGSVDTQFIFDEDGKEVERSSSIINWFIVDELRLLPRGVDNSVLPQYTYRWDTDTFFRNGEPLDTMYEGERPEKAELVYCRHNTITSGSVLKPGSLSRGLQLGHITVLQCIGWCVGGIAALSDDLAKKCMICVDERGNWRPWKLV